MDGHAEQTKLHLMPDRDQLLEKGKHDGPNGGHPRTRRRRRTTPALSASQAAGLSRTQGGVCNTLRVYFFSLFFTVSATKQGIFQKYLGMPSDASEENDPITDFCVFSDIKCFVMFQMDEFMIFTLNTCTCAVTDCG